MPFWAYVCEDCSIEQDTGVSLGDSLMAKKVVHDNVKAHKAQNPSHKVHRVHDPGANPPLTLPACGWNKVTKAPILKIADPDGLD